jgi:hypothetical protein
VLAYDEKKVKHSMHAASVLVLLGLIGSVYRFLEKVIVGGMDKSSIILILMMVICIIFLILAVNSFIEARKNREKTGI